MDRHADMKDGVAQVHGRSPNGPHRQQMGEDGPLAPATRWAGRGAVAPAGLTRYVRQTASGADVVPLASGQRLDLATVRRVTVRRPRPGARLRAWAELNFDDGRQARLADGDLDQLEADLVVRAGVSANA